MNFFLLWLTTFLGVFIFTDVTIGIYLRMLNVNKIKHIITYNVQDTLIRTLFSIRKCTTCREKFEYTKGVIRICISKNEIQYNGQMKKDKRTNNDLQNITQKTKDQATRTTIKTGDGRGCSGRVISSFSTCGIRRVTLVTNPLISHKWGKNRIVIMTNVIYP